MKKILLSLVFAIICLSVHAQVGIGTTTPNPAAELDIVSSDKGILIPRLEMVAVTSPIDGMMIYQPSDSSFYYFKGIVWTKIADGIASEMIDTDGDTKISLREGMKDSIVFSLDGIEHLKLVKSATGSLTAEYLNNNSNIAMGDAALSANSTGNNNIAIGDSTLSENTTGRSNIALGSKALQNNEAGFLNVAIGERALISNTGDFNVAIAGDALLSNTSGSENIAIGVESLLSNTTGNYNTAIGRKALFKNTSGIGNIAIGEEALFNNTTGKNNIAQGSFALNRNENGNNNIAQGSFALNRNQNGSNNIALLGNALQNNTTGDNNIAQGSFALNRNQNGNNNIAIGRGSLYSNIEGDDNIANGYRSLHSNTTGNNNIALGDSSLYSNITGNGNIALGSKAGLSETGDNKLYIENSDADKNSALIYGEFDNDMLRINDKLGIGTESTGYPLSIKGDINNDFIMFKDNAENDQWHLKLKSDNLNFVESGVAEDRFVLEEGGNVGFGLSNPEHNLHVKSNGDATLKLEADADNSNESDNAQIEFSQDGEVVKAWLGYDETRHGSNNFGISTMNKDGALLISNDGNLGINGTAYSDLTTAIHADAGDATILWLADENDNAKLQVEKDGSFSFNRLPANNVSGIIRANAGDNAILVLEDEIGNDQFTVFKNGNANLVGTLTQNSDERLKRNITNLSTVMPLLSQISGYQYQWKEEHRSPDSQIGLLAQEVQTVFPNLVHEGEDGILSVNYMGFVPLLIESSKEQKAIIDEQEARIDVQEKRIQKLEEMVNQLMEGKN